MDETLLDSNLNPDLGPDLSSDLNPDVDVAIVGGGIHGAGIAQALIANGYSCALIEKDDWASGTSSKSSKLIHGGLRYLESGQLRLVYHCLRERSLLLRNAPELVKPLSFHIPVYGNTSRPPWIINIGLLLYKLLCITSPLATFKRLGQEERNALDSIKTDGLKTVFRYKDAQTDDAALTQSVVKSAQVLGAECFTHCELLEARRENSGNQGLWHITVAHQGQPKQLRAKMLVNAAGPWVNRLAERCQPGIKQLPISLVRGTHMVLDHPLTQGAYYLEAPQDQRAVFVLPWYGKTLLGTTEKDHPLEQLDQVEATDEECDYLMAVFKHYFPTVEAQELGRFAGVRVLPADEGSAFSRSRDTRFLSDDGYVAVYGGKLTSYRHTAHKVQRLVQKQLGKKPQPRNTATIALPDENMPHPQTSVRA